MNFSHVIYNSSEKNRSGGVGFGVRSATAGIQPQLLAAMEQNGVFSFKESNVALSPSALFENPDLIKQTAPSYFFQVVALPDQTKGYVIGRKIAVGFDYTFYLNGRPGRLGNYVVDSYVFHECPTAEAFEILLENPAPGSLRFIPADPSPRNENEEMRRISVGHKPDLEQENGQFRSAYEVELNSKAIDLLFAFIQSRKSNKPLLVKAAPEEAPRLMAALATLLPQESIPNMTFVTNHNEQGLRAGINICFISQNYRFEIFPNLWVVLDLNSSQRPESQEYAMFAPMVEQYLRTGDLRKVRAIAAWCLSQTYEASKAAPQATQKALFAYIHDFDAFDYRLIASDEKLKELLLGLLKQAPGEKQKLEDRLQKRLDTIDHHQDLKAWIDYIRKIRPIELKELAARNREHINKIIFDDARAFQSFYGSYRNVWTEIVRDYIDSDKFLRYSYYISNFDSDQWEELYPYFLKEIIDRKETPKLILRMFEDGVTPKARQRIIDKEIPDKGKQAEVFVAILTGSSGTYDGELIYMLVDISRELGACPIDFFETFNAHLAENKYAPLFACQLELSRVRNIDALRLVIDRVKLFLENPKGEEWLKGKGGQDLLARVFTSLAENVKSGAVNREDAKEICDSVGKLPVSQNVRQNFSWLSRVLQRSNFYDDAEVEALWNLAAQLGDKEYMKMLAPDFLKFIEKVDHKRLQKASAGYPQGLVVYLINEGILSEAEILSIAAKSNCWKIYYTVLMGISCQKPQEEYDFLTQKAGLSDDEALGFLSHYLPESYKKIMKSRQPSVWSKISGGLKGMFSKKDKSDDDSKGGPDSTSKGKSNPSPYPSVPASGGHQAAYNPNSQNRRKK